MKHVLPILAATVLLCLGAARPCAAETIPAPPGLAVHEEVPPTFFFVFWSPVIGATGYELEESADAGFKEPQTVYTGGAFSFQVVGKKKGTWFYRVRAWMGPASSAWTEGKNPARVQELSLFEKFVNSTGFSHLGIGNVFMFFVGILFIYLAIKKKWEPLLLLPIGFGILAGNIPSILGFRLGVYDEGSVFYYLYFGVRWGIYPPLIFLGIGAMTDFTSLLSNPKLLLLGAAAQVGIFITFAGALLLGFTEREAGAIGIIGGADGPTAIFLSSMLAPHLIGPIAIAAYSYMALVPLIQPPIIRLLTTREERLIRMKEPRKVGKVERIIFPVIGFLLTCLIAPGAISLLGMLFFGNLLRESGVTERLAETARMSMVDIVTILIGFIVGASAAAEYFLTWRSVGIFVLGASAFALATAGGVTFAKIMNLFVKDKVNPIIGAAGVSAVPDSARVAQHVGQQEDPTNFLLMHAMGPNVAGVIGSGIAAGILWSLLTS